MEVSSSVKLISLKKWSHKAGIFFVYNRIYKTVEKDGEKSFKWTPWVKVFKRYTTLFGFFKAGQYSQMEIGKLTEYLNKKWTHHIQEGSAVDNAIRLLNKRQKFNNHIRVVSNRSRKRKKR